LTFTASIAWEFKVPAASAAASRRGIGAVGLRAPWSKASAAVNAALLGQF